jgi:prepilin-type N-terminal cleavage/methylation domain-containing protein
MANMITKKIPAQACVEKPNKGFTLTEIAIVLGIIGLILGAIWVAAAGVYTNQKVGKANTEILNIVQAVRGLYSTNADLGTAPTANDLTGTMISAGAVPSDMVSNGTLTDPWGSGATFITWNSNSSFLVEMTNVPLAACIALISTIAGTGRDPTLFEAVADIGGATGTAGVATGAVTVAVTPSDAVKAASNGVGGCTGGAGSLYTMHFGFQLK